MFDLRSGTAPPAGEEERTRAVLATMEALGPAWRESVGTWVADLLSVETLVPDEFAHWRPMVHDCMAFISSHLSKDRLIVKIVEQLDLPPDTPVEERLIRVIAKTPGLQKLGQVLARTRELSPALRRALQQLENSIADMTPGAIRSIIEAELGSVLRAYDVELSDTLLTEGSVSAVLEFTWRNPATGARERGVFKVIKPHVPLFFAEDLELLKQLAEFLTSRERNYGFSSKEIPEMLEEVRLLLSHEVDFRREQVTLAEVNRLYRRKGVRAPRPLTQFCTGGITAMTAEYGVKVTEAYRNSAFWRRRVATQVIESLLADPMFSAEPEAVFHADPHAGNLLYDERTRELIVLDWALTGRLGLEERRNVARLIFSMTFRDRQAVRQSVHALSRGGNIVAIDDYVDGFFAALPHACSPGAIDAMRLVDGMGIAGVRFPPSLVLIRKVMFTLDGVLHDIAGDSIRLDSIIAAEFARRWISGFGAIPPPFTPVDLLRAQWSAVRYATGVWAFG